MHTWILSEVKPVMVWKLFFFNHFLLLGFLSTIWCKQIYHCQTKGIEHLHCNANENYD